MGLFGKSEKQKWDEAKQRAHKQRAANGQRHTKHIKTYTANEQIKDQRRTGKP